MNLYELSSKYQALLDYAQSVDMTDEDQAEAYQTTIESLDDAIEEKAEGYSIIIKELEATEDKLAKEINRLQARKKSVSNNIKRMKTTLLEELEKMDKRKVTTDKFVVYIQNNPPSLVVEDESEIPKAYWVEQAPKLNTKLLKEDLLDEEYPSFSGARIEQGRSLRIK